MDSYPVGPLEGEGGQYVVQNRYRVVHCGQPSRDGNNVPHRTDRHTYVSTDRPRSWPLFSLFLMSDLSAVFSELAMCSAVLTPMPIWNPNCLVRKVSGQKRLSMFPLNINIQVSRKHYETYLLDCEDGRFGHPCSTATIARILKSKNALFF